jgi:hypothetical protein
MSFYAKSFIYDGKSSELYGLVCASQSGGQTTSPAGSTITILEEYVNRRETPYFYGVSFPEKLQFDIEFYSENPIPRQKVSEIERWLFGLSGYKRFEVIQEDMERIYYNCLFTNANLSCTGNEVYGFNATCVCDSPWAWGETLTQIKNTVTSTMTINNTSDNTRFTKPTIKLVFDANYDTVYVENISATTTEDEDYGSIATISYTAYDYDLISTTATEFEDYGDLSVFSSNAMIFEDITDGEIIDINTDLRYITSNRESIVNRFNGKYLYLLPDENVIYVSETISRIELSYIPARKVGA